MPIMVNSLAILPQVVVGSITVGVNNFFGQMFYGNVFELVCDNSICVF